jgi:hypothetical protein
MWFLSKQKQNKTNKTNKSVDCFSEDSITEEESTQEVMDFLILEKEFEYK